MVAKVDLTGKTFGRLTVIDFAGTRRTSGGTSVRTWCCLCSCGNTLTVDGSLLRSGNTQSCGCLWGESIIKHGMHKDRIYQTWKDMKSRCDNPKCQAYPRYGGRGITYQESWSEFDSFYSDMKEGYADSLTLERKDVEGNYCKENCTWETREVQSRNKGMHSKNKTGFTGVRTLYDKKTETVYYVAEAKTPDGKKYSKHYSTKKYGEDGAFAKAKAKRQEFISEISDMGFEYGINHGKFKE